MDSQEGVFANKVPMLKPNEFDMWKIRIRQHMLLIDYSMWEVIENGPAERKAGEDGVVPPPRTDAERKARQIEMKALSTLLFAIPNEYQHQFKNCENAKVLWQALERRFAGSKSTKRNQKAILRQQYENFMSTKNETMTQTFDRYNKLIGELVTVGVKIDNDDINRKFLRSLGEEWTMYTVSLRQSEDLEDKELDDLYNDLRVFEAEVEAKRKPIGYSHNTALLSNESSQFNDSNSHNSGASESFNAAKPNSGVDQTLEAFLASHVKTSLINEDLEQISPDDLEEMDIKWQMAMLTMRIKRFIKRTGRNNFGMKREDGAGFDKSKVRCYKCNDLGHFARECKGNASQHNHQHKFNKNSNGSSSQALVSQEGFGFDWSDQADEAVQNQALMAEIKESSSSEIPSEVISKLCSKSCIDTVQKYRDHNQSMCDSIKKLEQFRRESNEVIGSLEDQIKAYQANELQFEYDQNYWKWEKKEYELKLSKCRSELEKVRVELEQSKSDLEKFSKASKAVDEILKAQINDDLKRGIGYHTTPPPYNNNYIPPKSNFADRLDTEELKPGLTEVDPVEGEVEDLGGEGEYRKKEIEESVPDDNHILTNENGGRPFVESNKVVKEKGKSKIDARSSECDPSSSKQSQYKRGNQRNWNNQWAKSHGIDLSKINRPKPCFICCKLNHLAKDCYFNPINHRNSFQNFKSSMVVRKKQQFQAKKVEFINKKVVSNQNRKFQSNEKVLKKKVETKSVKMTAKWVPKAVVHNNAATSDKSSNNSESNKKITTASCSSTPVNAASSSNKNNATPVITASTPEKKKPYIVTKYSSHEIPSTDYMLKLNRLAEFKYGNQGKGKNLWHVDSGCSRHMTGIMSLLENFKQFNGGHVAFGDNPKGGKTSDETADTSETRESQLQEDSHSEENITLIDPVTLQEEDADGSQSSDMSIIDPLLSHQEGYLDNPHSSEVTPSNQPEPHNNMIDSSVVNEEGDAYESNLGVNLPEEPLHLTRTQKNHPSSLVIGNIQSPMITRKQCKDLGFKNPHSAMFSCFLSQSEPKKVFDAMKDPSWIEAMQEELLQFVLQHVWDLTDLPKGHRAIGTKWIFRNKKDERGWLHRDTLRRKELTMMMFFAPVARIEAIRLFLAFASFKKFKVYQMDVKSAFLYGKIEEEVYVCQPPGFEDPKFPDKVYKLRKALYGLHQAPRAWYDTLSTYLLENQFERGVIDKTLFIKKKGSDLLLVQIYVDDIIFGATKEDMCKEFEDLMHKRFKMSSMGELTFFLGLQVKQKNDGLLINQSKYVKDMLTKFGFLDAKSASTPMETHKQLTADVEGEEVDVHQYRSMIGSLMYLTASRPDIMFAVCVCARFQVRPKESHLQAIKRIFRYLKGQPGLGLWYPYESPFELLAYTDSDYGGASLDRKSTSGGCQFLGARLVSWQCKKQTTVSTSTAEAEYVAAAQCCSQVLWIQNQMLDYGMTFLNTPVYIDNNSAISIVNNPVKHSKTKHIEIKYHFIRDSNEKKLIQVLKVHTDYQYADLFTKAFDVGRFKFLITSVGMINSE
ncbi:hypothetical protein OSB04_015745 [Centaurea solstitialis]|uniref:CCHC-type domain-containing protein n=1 Tax=Centaurea solstitialis TaxID=347529 RepID=A0AA38SZM3_9ASTR|nr:hypothetical protein OSB04_015745 [Centaurea solstitialis]